MKPTPESEGTFCHGKAVALREDGYVVIQHKEYVNVEITVRKERDECLCLVLCFLWPF